MAEEKGRFSSDFAVISCISFGRWEKRYFQQISSLLSIDMAEEKGKALIILAEGNEEMEAVITADVLRRGKVKTIIGGLNGTGAVVCSRDVKVVPDMDLQEAWKQGPYSAVIIPGGLKGAENIAQSSVVKGILTEQEKNGGIVAAICAGPTALLAHGIGKGKKVTSYPSFKDQFKGYEYLEDRVVRDGQIITSRGPGTAFEFGIELVRAIREDSVADGLAAPMLLK